MEALSVHDARASYALCRAGDDWCAVGDARFAPDPLSGLGILWAIEDGVWTAEALSRGAAGLRAAAEERAARQMTEYPPGMLSLMGRSVVSRTIPIGFTSPGPRP